jgi:hypothetical protein
LPWVDEVKYLGIVILRSRFFKCSFDQSKRAFYRLNAIFGQVGRLISEEVLLLLVNGKCLPVLLYGTEACPLNKSDNNSLDFIMNRFLMKLFETINRDILSRPVDFTLIFSCQALKLKPELPNLSPGTNWQRILFVVSFPCGWMTV